MADKDKGGDKTELPTPKKLQDARKKGDIAKGREFTTTLGSFVVLALLLLAGGWIGGRIATYADQTVTLAATGDFDRLLVELGREAIWVLVGITAAVAIPLAAVGTLSEMLQTRGLIAPKRLKPNFEKMNPIEGFKRMFGKDGLVELIKTLAKAAAVLGVVWLVMRGVIPQLGNMLTPATAPVFHEGAGAAAAMHDLEITRDVTLRALGWIATIFVGVAFLDLVWTKHSFIKKMMMSRRDIRQEMKQDEGDPHIKGHRRQLHQEWANSGAVMAAGNATALLVNPTHLAIALEYDAEYTPVPVISARGEGDLAAMMRDAATNAGVPIIRHVPTARQLWARGEVGEIVPEDLFDAVAEVILWARRARDNKAPMECDLTPKADGAEAA